MKRIIALFVAVIAAFSAYSQTSIQDGDRCFDGGDYTCAITNYDNAFKIATGKDKQIAEIKLTRAKWCADHIKTANQAFNSKSYKTAIENYQNVLDSNPNDEYAKRKITECNKFLNPTNLSISVSRVSFDNTGGVKTVSVTTNANSYRVTNVPVWCKIEQERSKITLTCEPNKNKTERSGQCTITADDKSTTLYLSQSAAISNTPQKAEITLSVFPTSISFDANGGTKRIYVTATAADYSLSYIPSWCHAVRYATYIDLTVGKNNNESRNDWFQVNSGLKLVRVYVTQAGVSTTVNKSKPTPTVKGCFNCPKGKKHTVGLSFGYVVKPIISDDFDYMLLGLSGGSLGLRIEPLFNHGFGLNTGVFYEYYPEQYNDGNSKMAINIPLNLEYRLNFHKNFSMFFIGGASVDYNINATADFNFSGYVEPFPYNGNFDKNRFVPYLEYGGGIRIKKVQFNAGLHYFVDIEDDFTIYDAINYSVSCSIMF
jgi:hypothetical protein